MVRRRGVGLDSATTRWEARAPQVRNRGRGSRRVRREPAHPWGALGWTHLRRASQLSQAGGAAKSWRSCGKLVPKAGQSS